MADDKDLSLLMYNLGLSKSKVLDLMEKNELVAVRPQSMAMELIDHYFTQSNADPYLEVSVAKVWSVRCKYDEELYQINKFGRKISSMLLWHGTPNYNVASILGTGFKRRSEDSDEELNLDYGPGLYFADRVNKSINFSQHTTPLGFLFLSEVATGLMKEKMGMKTYYYPPDGYDSIKGLGNWQPDPYDFSYLDDILVPWGRTKYCSEVVGNKIRFNEYVVYNPRRVLIKYLVAFSNKHDSD